MLTNDEQAGRKTPDRPGRGFTVRGRWEDHCLPVRVEREGGREGGREDEYGTRRGGIIFWGQKVA